MDRNHSIPKYLWLCLFTLLIAILSYVLVVSEIHHKSQRPVLHQRASRLGYLYYTIDYPDETVYGRTTGADAFYLDAERVKKALLKNQMISFTYQVNNQERTIHIHNDQPSLHLLFGLNTIMFTTTIITYFVEKRLNKHRQKQYT